MGNFTLSEILTIVLVILIIFGPNRLPEMARKAGEWTAKARKAANSFRDEIRAEYGEDLAPIRQVRDDLRGISSEMREGIAKMDRGMRDSLDSAKEAFEVDPVGRGSTEAVGPSAMPGEGPSDGGAGGDEAPASGDDGEAETAT